jgi:hypothetical protein
MPPRPHLADEESPIAAERVERAPSREASKRHWFVRLLRRAEAGPESPPAVESVSNPLLAFASEGAADAEPGTWELPAEPNRGPGWTWPVPVAALGIILVAAALAFGLIQRRLQAVHAAAQATLTVETRPTGAEVLIDGQRRGDSPLTLSLSAGTHAMTLRRDGDERTVPVTLAAGAQVKEYLELTPSETAPVQGGQVSVITDPPGARVKVDGEPRGTSPVVVTGLSAANHLVAVANANGVAERTIAVERGTSTSVVFSLPKPTKPLEALSATLGAPLAGWLTVAAPFDVQVLERDEVVGASGITKIMLASGRHDVDLVNQTLDYRERRRIDVTPGKVTTLRIDPPTAALSANARPWADVWIDGTSVGQTPIANLSVPIGTHQVIFRHPQFGERRETIVVTSKGPNRIAMDLSK